MHSADWHGWMNLLEEHIMNNWVLSMSTDGRAVANFVLDFCEYHGRPVTNLSLQKIVYFCHVWSLIEMQRPLLRHQFEAWQYGPVLQYLYREFKRFDDRPIAARATRINPTNGTKETVPYVFDQMTLDLLKKVTDFYSQLRAGDLVALSHAKGGPWEQTWNHRTAVNPGMRIDDDSISSYYSTVRPPFLVQ